jgi:hypothetical protein
MYLFEKFHRKMQKFAVFAHVADQKGNPLLDILPGLKETFCAVVVSCYEELPSKKLVDDRSLDFVQLVSLC